MERKLDVLQKRQGEEQMKRKGQNVRWITRLERAGLGSVWASLGLGRHMTTTSGGVGGLDHHLSKMRWDSRPRWATALLSWRAGQAWYSPAAPAVRESGAEVRRSPPRRVCACVRGEGRRCLLARQWRVSQSSIPKHTSTPTDSPLCAHESLQSHEVRG